jgi:hypothetical protein
VGTGCSRAHVEILRCAALRVRSAALGQRYTRRQSKMEIGKGKIETASGRIEVADMGRILLGSGEAVLRPYIFLQGARW